MSLRKKQSEFARCIMHLESYIWGIGFEITFGDAFRSPKATFPYSHPRSTHMSKLGRDYFFYKNGVWVVDFETLLPIGEYWESLDNRARWGGRFKDCGHFSFEHGGVK